MRFERKVSPFLVRKRFFTFAIVPSFKIVVKNAPLAGKKSLHSENENKTRGKSIFSILMTKLHNTETRSSPWQFRKDITHAQQNVGVVSKRAKHSRETFMQHWDDFRQVWSFNSIAKSSGKFHLRSPVECERGSKTITQQGNIGSAHNPKQKHHEAEARKLTLGYFLPFQPIQTDSRWCLVLAGSEKGNVSLRKRTCNFNSVEFLVDIGRKLSLLSLGTDFIKTEIVSRWILIIEGLIGPQLIEWKLDEANQVRETRTAEKSVKRESDVKEFPKWNILPSLDLDNGKDENVSERKMKVEFENECVMCDVRKQLAWQVVGWAGKKWEIIFWWWINRFHVCPKRRQRAKVVRRG